MKLCVKVYTSILSANSYGSAKPPRRHRIRKHARRLKRLTKEKNEARKQLCKAKTSILDISVIQYLAQKFHRLVRLHSSEKKSMLRSKCQLEALKARGQCRRAF